MTYRAVAPSAREGSWGGEAARSLYAARAHASTDITPIARCLRYEGWLRSIALLILLPKDLTRSIWTAWADLGWKAPRAIRLWRAAAAIRLSRQCSERVVPLWYWDQGGQDGVCENSDSVGAQILQEPRRRGQDGPAKMNSVNSADQGKGDKNALSFALIFIAITPTSL
jgi:hypothetical protein